MGGKAERQKDLREARERRAATEAAKKQAALRMLRDNQTVKDIAAVVRADLKTVRRWRKEMGNG